MIVLPEVAGNAVPLELRALVALLEPASLIGEDARRDYD
jgi:hypothetical protein